MKHIAQTHRKRLLGTFSLVGVENILMLVYPVFGGRAINAVIAGKVWQALLYALVVFLMWLVGAARRITDTRTFTRIYTEIAVPVVLEQRQRQVPHSAVTARVALSREFVSFFEEHLPIAETSVVSIFGACIMLLVLEFWVGVLAVCILALFLWLLPRFAAISENLYFRLNNSLERDNHFIRKGDRRQLYRHYGLVARLRVLISNREAFGYLCVGAAMGILFGFAFVMMTLKGYGSAGHVYSVSTYKRLFTTTNSYQELRQMNEHNLLIFCLKDNVSISEYTEMIDWAYKNIQSETVVEITENQIIEYQNRGLWRLVSEITDNWLFGPSEGDWLIDKESILAVKEKLQNSVFSTESLVKNIIHVLEYTIKNEKTVIFHF